MKFSKKEFLPHLIAIIAIALISAVYFLPAFQGKVISQSDIVSHRAMSKEMVDYEKKLGRHMHWTNSIFGGMPTYQITTYNDSNLLTYVAKLFKLGFKHPYGSFVLGMIGFYILMLTLGAGPWLSLIGAFCFAFATNNIVLLDTGHTSKLTVVASLPLVLAGVIKAFDKRYIWGGILFAIGMGLSFFANHPQMLYYFLITLLIYGVIKLVEAIKNGEIPHLLKAVGVLVIGLILGIGSSATNILTTLEFQSDTIRGGHVLEKTSANTKKDSKGLDWDYAMQWSNSGKDLLAIMIPRAIGGSSGEDIGKDSKFYKLVRQTKAPTYWGDLIATSGPNYLGAILMFLFLFGFLVTKGTFRYWLLASLLFTILLSMGRHFASLQHLFFDYFPFFNKFRAPSSAMSITILFTPILALLGLRELTKAKEKSQFLIPLYISFAITGGFCLIMALMGTSLFDFTSAVDQRRVASGAFTQPILDALVEDRMSIFSKDAWRSFALILVSAAAVFAFIKDWIKWPILFAAIGLLTVVDFWGVGTRYLNSESFITPRTINNSVKARPVDEQILKDPDLHYRVMDFTIDAFQSASSSRHHKTIGGYNAAKLRRYNDLIEQHLSKNNQQVYNMLNTKYFITRGQQNQGPIAQNNAGALGNAWFVSNVNFVNSNNAEFDGLNNFNAGTDAIVHEDFKDQINNKTSWPNQGTIQLTDYAPDKLTYKSNTTAEQLAIFSEVWYGPNKGWNAYIDGEAVDHIRANYILRGLKIPAGEHEIVFEFKPATVKTGNLISLISSALIILGSLFFIFDWYRKRPATVETFVQEKTVLPATKKKIKKKKKGK